MAGGWTPKTLVTKNNDTSAEKTENLDSWDPMKEDYNCPVFNSYRPMNMTDAIRRLSDLPKVQSSSTFKNNSPSNNTGIQLYIRNIPHKLINKNQLKEIFETAGQVVNTKLITSNPDLPYSYGFITYSTEMEAVTAMKRFNGKNLDPEKQLKPLAVSLAAGSRDINEDLSLDNHKMPFKRQDSSSGSPTSVKCECCGKAEIKFRCDKCNKVGYCSGKCLAKNEAVHESNCSSTNGNPNLTRSTSIFSKNKSLLTDSVNTEKPMIPKPAQNKTPHNMPVVEKPTVQKVVESNCPDASTKKFVHIPQNEIVHLVVTHIERPNKFYCVINSSTVEERMHDFNDFLNSTKLEQIVGPPKVGSLVVAPFEGCLYRAVIISTSTDSSKGSNITANVLFVDFGNKEQVLFSSLKTCFHDRFSKFQYQAIECSFKDMKHFNEKASNEGSSFTAKVVMIDGRTHLLSLNLEAATSPEKCVVNINPSKVSNSTFNSASADSAIITPLTTASFIPVNSQNSPPSISLVVGNKYRFKPTNINGQNFYVKLADKFSKSLVVSIEQNLSVNSLKSFAESDGENSDDANGNTIDINTPCLYVLSDGGVHRGRILYSIQDGSYLVFDVDNGNKSVVTVDNLYHASELFSQVAEQSILCTGDTKCRNTIKSLLKNHQEAMLTVMTVERNPVLKYTVAVVSTCPPPNVTSSPTRVSATSNFVSLLTEDLISLAVEDENQTSELKMEVMEYPTNEMNLIKLASRHVTVGSQFEVLISHFNDENDFYVHLFESGCTSDLNVITLRLVNDFSTSGCNKKTPLSFERNQVFIPQGTPVVAYDSEDHLYYRCELISNVSKTDEKFQVLSVDFGKTFTASMDKCYVTDHTLCIYPKVAVHCCLNSADDSLLSPDLDLQSLYESNSQAVFTLKFNELLTNGKYVVQIHNVDA